MPYTFNPFTGTLDYYAASSGSGVPGGSSGDLQYNNAGAFGGYTPGTGIATWLQTPTSANLAAAVTGETGSGALVFANTPTLVTPAIGAATGTSLVLSGLLSVDSPTLVVDAVNHRVGMGTASPTVPCYITGQQSAVTLDGATQFAGLVGESTSTDTSTTAIRYAWFGINANLASNPASQKVVVGMFGAAITPAGLGTTLTNLSLRALNSSAIHNGTATLKDCWGGNYGATNNSTGIVTNLTNVRAIGSNANAGGTVVNYKSFEAATLVNNGTITNTYGYYCGVQTSGTQTNLPYAFYNADADAVNYFLGSTIPRLTVAADATSITPDSRYCNITQQTNTQAAGALTINADAGIVSPKPYNGQSWTLKIKSTNVQTFAWDAVYIGGATPLPTASTGGAKTDYYSFLYDTIASKWDYTGSSLGF